MTKNNLFSLLYSFVRLFCYLLIITVDQQTFVKGCNAYAANPSLNALFFYLSNFFSVTCYDNNLHSSEKIYAKSQFDDNIPKTYSFFISNTDLGYKRFPDF